MNEPSFVNEFIERDPEAEEIFQRLNWENASQETRLPELTYLFEIRDVAGVWTSEPKRFMVQIVAEVLQPSEYARRFHRENYYVGTTDDPTVVSEKLLDASAGPGARSAHAMMTACGIKHPRDAKGKQFCASVQHNGDFANLFNYAPAGSVIPGQTVQPRQFTKRAPRGSATPQAPVPTAPTEGECPTCHNMFPTSDLPFHMSGCTDVK